MGSPENKAAPDARVEEEDVAAKAVVGTFQVKLALSQQRELVITGHLYDNDTPRQINRRIDCYQDVADRQLVRADIHNKEAQNAQLVAGIEQHRDLLESLKVKQEASKKGAKGPGDMRVKLTSQEQQMLANGWESVKALEKQVASNNAAIAAARAKLAG